MYSGYWDGRGPLTTARVVVESRVVKSVPYAVVRATNRSEANNRVERLHICESGRRCTTLVLGEGFLSQRMRAEQQTHAWGLEHME